MWLNYLFITSIWILEVYTDGVCDHDERHSAQYGSSHPLHSHATPRCHHVRTGVNLHLRLATLLPTGAWLLVEATRQCRHGAAGALASTELTWWGARRRRDAGDSTVEDERVVPSRLRRHDWDAICINCSVYVPSSWTRCLYDLFSLCDVTHDTLSV